MPGVSFVQKDISKGDDFIVYQAEYQLGQGLGRGRAYGVDAFLISPEQAFFTIGFDQTNE